MTDSTLGDPFAKSNSMLPAGVTPLQAIRLILGAEVDLAIKGCLLDYPDTAAFIQRRRLAVIDRATELVGCWDGVDDVHAIHLAALASLSVALAEIEASL
jgi:hypothetical protein